MRAKFALCTQRILAYFCAKVLRFLQWEIFSMDRKILKIPGINLHCLGNIWAKIISCHPPYKPIFAKNVLFRVQKYPKKTFRFLSKGRLNLMAKYSEPKKQIAKTFFPLGATRAWSSNLCAAEFEWKDDMMTRGGGALIAPKSDDVIYEQQWRGTLPIVTNCSPSGPNVLAW